MLLFPYVNIVPYKSSNKDSHITDPMCTNTPSFTHLNYTNEINDTEVFVGAGNGRDLYAGEFVWYYCFNDTWMNITSQNHKFRLDCVELTPTTADWDWTGLQNPPAHCVPHTPCVEPPFFPKPVISDHVIGTPRINGDYVRYQCNDSNVYELNVDGSPHTLSYYDTLCAWGGAWDLSVTFTCPRKLLI